MQIARWFPDHQWLWKGECNISELSFWSLTVSALWDFGHLNFKEWGTSSCWWQKAASGLWSCTGHAHSLLRVRQTAVTHVCESNSWCFLTWCYVYISWSNEFVPCWKWSHTIRQYSDTVGLVMKSHNLRTGKILVLSIEPHQNLESNLDVQWAILLGSEHLT